MRPDKLAYYLDMAQTVSERSTCLRTRYGAVIVKNDEVVSTGYNGAPRGCKNCSDVGSCPREMVNTAHGDAYNLCFSVHAEMNAMLSAARSEMLGGSIYICGIRTSTGKYSDPNPCLLCHRMLINSGIANAYGRFYDPAAGTVMDCPLDISPEFFIQRVRAEYDKLITRMDYDMAAALVMVLDKYSA